MRPPVPTALALAVVACGGGPDAALVTIDTLPGGVVRVMNHGPSAWSDTNGWKLVLEHTIQPAEGEPGELGRPWNIALHPNGSVLVGEMGEVPVKRYGPSGEFMGDVGRNGGGPGEYRNSTPAWLGDSIVVQDSRGAGRVLIYDPNGTHVRTFPGVCCAVGPPVLVTPDKDIILTGIGGSENGRAKMQWVRFAPSGERLDSVFVPQLRTPAQWSVPQPGGTAAYAIPFNERPIASRLHDGRVAHGMGGSYELHLTSSGSDTLLVFGMTDPAAVVVPDSLRRQAYDRYAERPGFTEHIAFEDVPSRYPLWHGLAQDALGHLWISRPGPEGGTARFDIFTVDGRFLGTVPLDEPTRGPASVVLSGDRMAVMDTDADDLPRIRVYRIERQ